MFINSPPRSQKHSKTWIYVCSLEELHLLKVLIVFRSTLLKIKILSNSTWVNFKSFPLMKGTFSFSVDFSWLSDFKTYTQNWVIWFNTNLIKIKSRLSEVSVWDYWTYNRIYALDMNAVNEFASAKANPIYYLHGIEVESSNHLAMKTDFCSKQCEICS